ncbi:hypothetical protein BC941DRAFT_511969 [Chlamydoabsidia padenii]|nr:hypothetical protein BC941DRAFT_511969 [Chlamydoabsidia padenii]
MELSPKGSSLLWIPITVIVYLKLLINDNICSTKMNSGMLYYSSLLTNKIDLMP